MPGTFLPICQAFFFAIFLLGTNLESRRFRQDNRVMRTDNLLSPECHYLGTVRHTESVGSLGEMGKAWYLQSPSSFAICR